jgi:hypothetical protein
VRLTFTQKGQEGNWYKLKFFVLASITSCCLSLRFGERGEKIKFNNKISCPIGQRIAFINIIKPTFNK